MTNKQMTNKQITNKGNVSLAICTSWLQKLSVRPVQTHQLCHHQATNKGGNVKTYMIGQRNMISLNFLIFVHSFQKDLNLRTEH